MIGIRAALASVILLMLLNLSIASATTTVTFQPGAYIIDMSTAPPALNYANGLKPYGLVYDLIINKQVPVSWAISPTKTKDGIDFTVPSGTGAGSYRGGSFIIPVEFAGDALTTLNYWKNTKLVKVVGPTTCGLHRTDLSRTSPAFPMPSWMSRTETRSRPRSTIIPRFP